LITDKFVAVYYHIKIINQTTSEIVYFANLITTPIVKHFSKSANISQSYERTSSGMFL